MRKCVWGVGRRGKLCLGVGKNVGNVLGWGKIREVGCKEMWGEVWERVLGWRIVGCGRNVKRSQGKVWGSEKMWGEA